MERRRGFRSTIGAWSRGESQSRISLHSQSCKSNREEESHLQKLNMTNLKLLILVANLLLLRLVLADKNDRITAEHKIDREPSSSQQSSSAIALEQVNSLDYAPSGPPIEPSADAAPASPSAASSLEAQHDRPIRRSKSARQSAQVGQLLVSLLGQLEKTDFKRLLSDAMGTSDKPAPARRRPTNNSTSSPSEQRNRSGVLAAETGNLLSITKQLVKLARSQVIGGEFGAPIGSWLAPLAVPTMISAASHALHDSDWTGASLKSDWFWVVVPAVIVVGAGVIVVPLIAAWLVSHMMNQNTFTVSAGKRRRKRDLLSQNDRTLAQVHGDLFKLIDIHKLLGHELEPGILMNKLSQLHSAMDSFTRQFMEK